MLQDTFTIKELFNKNIERNINGVIQAGQLDEETKHVELEEYVMTAEIQENMEYFYNNYVKSLDQPTTNMGVWISGFFGSGKSHFLKILSYLLDSKTVYGKKPVDYFTEKTDNQTLLEQMRLVASYDTHAILFNIDSKASSRNRASDEKETITEVFLKVFNEHLGYSPTLWIADIERQIAAASDYNGFKQAFMEIAGQPWEEGRKYIKFKRKAFIEALEKVGVEKETAEYLLSTSNKEFSISSEEFAKLVAEHCEKQGPKYRLTFLVDEVGQYIGDNRNLMLNLQTIVEDLGKFCQGRVWVIVTSQEQIDTVTNIKGADDFSKIQGRFATRINLTSSNTDEVIQRRLLEKKDAAADELRSRYEMERQSLQNLLAFDRNHSALISGYRSVDDFVNLYPFVPYQVDLLQKVFEKIRKQGEAGKHLAHGERSLLNAFQQVAIDLKEESTEKLARFSQFYETIRRFLDGSIVSTINRARERENIEPFDVEVLKVLYMIKGIREIKATVSNITTLMIDSTETIKGELEEQVKKSLYRLKQAVLIQENADKTFTFLSDDEQEVKHEVERSEYNPANIDAHLGKIFFDEIYSAPRYRYKKLRDFDFNKKFNEFVKGSSAHELTLQVVTGTMSEEEARLASNSGTVIMRIPEELTEKFEEPLRYAEKIKSYLRLNDAFDVPEERKKIHQNLRSDIVDFEQEANKQLKEACKHATFFIQGKDYTFNGTVENQIDAAMEKLIENSYSKLGYVEYSIPIKEAKQTIREWGKKGLPLSTVGEFTNKLAFDEVLSYIQPQSGVILKQVIDHFKKMPFGWNEHDTAGIIAGLNHAGKVELVYLNEPFNADHPDFETRLLSAPDREKVKLYVKENMSPRDQGELTDLLRDVFNQYEKVETYDDAARLLRQLINEKLLARITEIESRSKQAKSERYPYPHLFDILHMKRELHNLLAHVNAKSFCQDVIDASDDLEEWSEKLDHFYAFYMGTGIALFDRSVWLLESRRDDLITYDEIEEVKALKEAIEAILTHPDPYDDIPNLSRLNERLENKLNELISKEAEEVIQYLEDVQSSLTHLEKQYERKEIQQQIAEHRQTYASYINHIRQAKTRSTLLTYKEKAERDYKGLLAKINDLAGHETVEYTISELLPQSEIWISTEEEVNRFVNDIKAKLLTAIQKGKVHIRR